MFLITKTLKKSKDSGKNVENLKKIIDSSIKKDRLNKIFLNDISSTIDLPHKVVEKKSKQIILKEFNYNKFKFQNTNNILINFFSNLKILFYFFSLLLCIHFFNFKKKKIYTSILIEDLHGERALNIYNKIIKKNKKTFLLLPNFFVSKYKLCPYKYVKLIPYKKDIFKNKKIVSLIFKYFFISLKYKQNFLKILFPIIYSYAKNFSKYSYINSNYLLHSRIYLSCPIRNYLYKKLGGKKIITIQSHIIENTISLYSDMDHLLTFGKSGETKKKLIKLGGRIDKIQPVGSLRMEYELDFKRTLTKKKIDILILGVNPTKWMDTSNDIKKNYYVFLDWIVKIAKLYPQLSITYKHHWSFQGDSIEDKILLNSNIKRIIKDKNNLSSYDYLNEGNLVLSFCSTMILEAQAINKPAFFIDPNNSSTTFFSYLPSLKELRINKFKMLEQNVKKFVLKKNYNYKIKDKNLICLKSKNVSNKILNYLKKK